MASQPVSQHQSHSSELSKKSNRLATVSDELLKRSRTLRKRLGDIQRRFLEPNKESL